MRRLRLICSFFIVASGTQSGTHSFDYGLYAKYMAALQMNRSDVDEAKQKRAGLGFIAPHCDYIPRGVQAQSAVASSANANIAYGSGGGALFLDYFTNQ